MNTTNPITLETLQKFCHPYRDDLAKPSNAGKFTVATDAAMMIWVPRLEGCEERPGFPAYGALRIIAAWKPTGDWQDIPTLPKTAKTCERCKGIGKITCNFGMCHHECQECGGDGKAFAESVTIFARAYSCPRLHLFASLPGVKIAAGKDAGGEDMLHITFDGGKGVLMPRMA